MTYEYHCKTCDETVEHICKMTDKPKHVKCPECGGMCKPIMPKVGSMFPQGRCKGGYERSKF